MEVVIQSSAAALAELAAEAIERLTNAKAVHHLVAGEVSAMWSATAVQHHPHEWVLIDDAAASRLRLADDYRQVWAPKPARQVL